MHIRLYKTYKVNQHSYSSAVLLLPRSLNLSCFNTSLKLAIIVDAVPAFLDLVIYIYIFLRTIASLHSTPYFCIPFSSDSGVGHLLARCRIPDQQLFFFITSKILFHCHPASNIAKKSVSLHT